MEWKVYAALAITAVGLISGFGVRTLMCPGTITETRITTDTANQMGPDVYSDIIVWTDDRNNPSEWEWNWDIYMYDLVTEEETQITTNTATQAGPAVYGDIIVWADGRNVDSEWELNLDIYMYDLSTKTETQITTDTEEQNMPDVYGDIIVWYDWRNFGTDNFWLDIYMYDLSTETETRITTAPEEQSLPDVYDDTIVWHDNRNLATAGYDIYMAELPSKCSAYLWHATFAFLPTLIIIPFELICQKWPEFCPPKPWPLSRIRRVLVFSGTLLMWGPSIMHMVFPALLTPFSLHTSFLYGVGLTIAVLGVTKYKDVIACCLKRSTH